MKKCLISGSTGLIGKVLIPVLIDQGWDVYSLERNPVASEWRTLHQIKLDLAYPWDTEAFPQEIEAVIHLAQSEHDRDFPRNAEDIFKVNTYSTFELLEYARKAKANKLILASSGGVYGHGARGFGEDRPLCVTRDLSFYLATKLFSEGLAASYSSFMPVIILRFFFVYGVGQRPDRLIPRLLKTIERGEAVVLEGRNGIRLNPIHVADAVQAIVRSLDLSETHTINVGGPEILSLRQICEQIGTIIGKRPVFDIQKHCKPRSIVGDIQKMRSLLFNPTIRFSEGLMMM